MSKHAIIITALVFTMLYGIGFAWLHWGIAADATAAKYIATNNLNTLGDFLAGFFSPLAFLWLTATVFIQSNELALQRQELADSRAVMKEQAQAAKDQAEFLSAQTEAMREQTALLTRQSETAITNAKMSHKLALFDQRYKFYEDFIAFGEKHDPSNFMDAYEEMYELEQRATFLFSKAIGEWLGEITQTIFDYKQFRQMHETFVDDGFGNVRGVIEDPEIKKQLEGMQGWLWEQFLPSERSEKFYHALRVSDE